MRLDNRRIARVNPGEISIFRATLEYTRGRVVARVHGSVHFEDGMLRGEIEIEEFLFPKDQGMRNLEIVTPTIYLLGVDFRDPEDDSLDPAYLSECAMEIGGIYPFTAESGGPAESFLL